MCVHEMCTISSKLIHKVHYLCLTQVKIWLCKAYRRVHCAICVLICVHLKPYIARITSVVHFVHNVHTSLGRARVSDTVHHYKKACVHSPVNLILGPSIPPYFPLLNYTQYMNVFHPP